MAYPFKKESGFIIYEGPSMLDGSPIVCIATMETSNKKTGGMIQTWIIRTDMKPIEASKKGLDDAICGSCIHRWSLGGACYVNLGHAPRAAYEAYLRGNYSSVLHAEQFEGRALRMGAYGDPAAVPVEAWEPVLKLVDSHTGYTHQVNHTNFDSRIAEYCTISADTPRQAAALQSKGLKTFRVKTIESLPINDEIECRADADNVQCIDCGLCDGKTNIYINVHGSRSKRYTEKYSKANLSIIATSNH